MINSTFREKFGKEWNYPCLGKHSFGGLSNVVLFSAAKCGVVVARQLDNDYQMGDYRTDWIMESFTPLEDGEQIILENLEK